MLVFINGKIGYGSPPAGRVYWTGNRGRNDGFISGAMNFFQDENLFFYNNDHGHISSAKGRFIRGYCFAADGLEKLPDSAGEEKVHFISMSMGAAFAEGMLYYMHEKKYNIGWVVHVNPFQASQLLAVDTMGRITVDYQLNDDPVIHNPLLEMLGISRKGDISGATYKIREDSGFINPLLIHRSPLWHQGENFWNKLKLKTMHNDNLA